MTATTKNTGANVLASTVATAEKASKKAENYSVETTEALRVAYESSNKTTEAVEALAKQFGKTTRSIIAKLSRMQVYVKPEYKTKNGETPISKEEIVANMAKLLGVDAEVLESLEKANKTALQIVFDALEVQSAYIETN